MEIRNPNNESINESIMSVNATWTVATTTGRARRGSQSLKSARCAALAILVFASTLPLAVPPAHAASGESIVGRIARAPRKMVGGILGAPKALVRMAVRSTTEEGRLVNKFRPLLKTDPAFATSFQEHLVGIPPNRDALSGLALFRKSVSQYGEEITGVSLMGVGVGLMGFAGVDVLRARREINALL